MNKIEKLKEVGVTLNELLTKLETYMFIENINSNTDSKIKVDKLMKHKQNIN